jgi:hypothetical protein
LAVLVADVEYLNASELSSFTGPENTDIHYQRLRKAIEGERDACHKIEGKFRSRGEQQAIFTGIQNEAPVGVTH